MRNIYERKIKQLLEKNGRLCKEIKDLRKEMKDLRVSEQFYQDKYFGDMKE